MIEISNFHYYVIIVFHQVKLKKKLMSTFYDKENYNISLLMLKYCLEKRTLLKKEHHVIYAKQSNFMKTFINFNNKKTAECSKNKDKFHADQCKSRNNSNFSK